MPEMHCTIEFDYPIGDREQRVTNYGTADLEKCARIDEAQDPLDLLLLASGKVSVTVTPKAPMP